MKQIREIKAKKGNSDKDNKQDEIRLHKCLDKIIF